MNIKLQLLLTATISAFMSILTLILALVYLNGAPLILALAAGAAGLAGSGALAYNARRTINTGMKSVSDIVAELSRGSVESAASMSYGASEFGDLARSFQTLALDMHGRTEQERALRLQAEEQAWVNDRMSEMAILMQGMVRLEEASRIFVGKLAAAVGASYGAVYTLKDGELHFTAGYAYDEEAMAGTSFKLGSGLIGQCALDQEPVMMDNLPADYVKVRSGLGDTLPASLMIVPVRYESETVAVVELASMRPLASKERQLVERTGANMGVLINTLADVSRINWLLQETQNQKEELEAQTEELQAQTEELQAQSQELEAQTEELLAQTAELAEANLQMKQQVELTEAQKLEIAEQADELKAQADELLNSNLHLTEQMEVTAAQKDEIAGQAEELRAQTKELQAQREELEAQTEELEAQTEELRLQAEELLTTNQHMKQQVETIEAQKREIESQANEIFQAAQYKSEFLANVSHELRTPLNSLLILSQILAENREGNLGSKQLEYVHTIFSAGKDLLQLIDEILDLAKLEVGKMAAVMEPVRLQDVRYSMLRHFEQMAKKKDLRFEVHGESRLPELLLTDGHRLQQILNNLLANAIKFTHQGSVSLSVRLSGDEVVFDVSDTGIGIAKDKLEHIFEAFQQADGTTSRKYGGTGLGLTICRELASLLGGRIEVQTSEGKGSTFSLFLPATEPKEGTVYAAAAAETEFEPALPAGDNGDRDTAFRESFVPDISISNPKLLQYSEMDDDRSDLHPEDNLLLIIEDDAEFARILLELARKRGFKAIVAFQGDQGLALAHAYKPDAIILDLHLPVLDGWSIISRLKSRPELRHIPVHVISTTEENQQSLAMGALGFWKKPGDQTELEAAFLQVESYIRRRAKSLLIVEDNVDLRSSLVAFIESPDVRVTAVGTGREALEQLSGQHFDCMVLDLGLSDISGFDLLEQIKTNRKLQTLPVIIYTGKELNKNDENRLRHYAENIVIKNVQSIERLYDETALYLHRRVLDLPPDKQQLIEKLHNPEAAFAGKRILLVDDDMRNIFALSSVLEGYNMNISFAQNGREALELLDQEGSVDLIFMDIMMPEMDGYETMQHIRSMPEYDKVVIIALTARAMEEDRQKCLEAGASDYISKPINTTQLVTMLKAWLIK